MALQLPPGRAGHWHGSGGPVGRGGQRGATYLGLLFVVATLGFALAAAGTLWSTSSRREREAELLFVGQQFRDALARFHDDTPVGQPPRFPRTLEELLDDRRWPTTRRHLRKVFVDPITGRAEWGLVRAPSGGVMGVHSLSNEVPIKRAGFAEGLEGFAGASTYRGWAFAYGATPLSAAPPAAAASSGASREPRLPRAAAPAPP